MDETQVYTQINQGTVLLKKYCIYNSICKLERLDVNTSKEYLCSNSGI